MNYLFISLFVQVLSCMLAALLLRHHLIVWKITLFSNSSYCLNAIYYNFHKSTILFVFPGSQLHACCPAPKAPSYGVEDLRASSCLRGSSLLCRLLRVASGNDLGATNRCQIETVHQRTLNLEILNGGFTRITLPYYIAISAYMYVKLNAN